MERVDQTLDHNRSGFQEHLGTEDSGKGVSENGFLAEKPGIYILIVLAATIGAWPFSFRAHSIFGCQSPQIAPDSYLAYCNTTGYGDYDYGAFWFGLERTAIQAASDASVLFLGNSRMQFGLSTEVTHDWFSTIPVDYYLLGFAYNGNWRFEGPLLKKLGPKATVYIINLDLFFEPTDTPPARIVMGDNTARSQYEWKRRWQPFHEATCRSYPVVCGNAAAFVRSRATGAWLVMGRGFVGQPVTYDENIDQHVVKTYVTSGNEFLSTLTVRSECVILTLVPYVNTGTATAQSIAAALGKNLVAPELEGLNTFDGIHLDKASAQRWSAAFFEAAGSQIRSCVSGARHD